MSVVKVQNLTIKFPIHSANALSLRNFIAGKLIGGKFRKELNTQIVYALDDVSFEIEPGDRIGLIGANGSGKSTLLRALAGIYPPASGKIEVAGNISTLFGTSLQINNDMSGYENLLLNSLVFTKDYKLTKQKMAEMAEFTELGENLNLPLHTYSEGMKVRVSFSSATNIASDVLLIDEIFGAGDKHFAEKSSKRITQLIDKSNSLFLATHSDELIRKFCNKAIYLSKGKLIEFGDVDKVLNYYHRTSP